MYDDRVPSDTVLFVIARLDIVTKTRIWIRTVMYKVLRCYMHIIEIIECS